MLKRPTGRLLRDDLLDAAEGLRVHAQVDEALPLQRMRLVRPVRTALSLGGANLRFGVRVNHDDGSQRDQLRSNGICL
jgi:hypothetical protein